MKIKIAAVQPKSFFGEDEHKNIGMALKYIDEAAEGGAQLICFPEGYPGPNSGPMPNPKLTEPPLETLKKKAIEKGVYIVSSSLDPNPQVEDTYFITAKLISPQGELLADYSRTHPNHPIFNAYLMGGRHHVAPGDELMVIDTEIGRIGLLVCSELFVPELSRILALRGADIIVAGGGGIHSAIRTRLTETWRCVARSRAAENIVFTVVTQNIFTDKARGRTCIASPEKMLGQREDPGIVLAECDMDRLNFLRTHFYDEDMVSPPEDESQVYYSRPGQIHDRRPEMYGDLLKSQEDAFDYKYYERGLDTWWHEYEKIKKLPKPVLKK